ncbi:hypothetical protein ACFFUB_09335 [Algimonas porphyrae]|uniref:Uncharacterized protein n=1 Tax=Algimonas porphyrae TaxID=1128113 RepID=A0ABQ5V499_9PROT|nr:hypothetical protein [Algimonas porphyrae]GLQ21683.1 hypothetical protein GCM10007854_26380 [Algimonas porphyrae]
MRLRRITEHIRDQNWTAVALDFFIVVIGVFIGIQVANWNAARAERALETVYMKRLHQEIIDLNAVREIRTTEREFASNLLRSALTKLSTPDGEALSKAECYVLADTPPVTNPTDELPLIIELLSSGRLTIFTNRELEEALGRFLIIRSRVRDSRDGIQKRLQNIDQDYSELFVFSGALSTVKMEAGTDIERYLQSAPVSCDETAMRQNQTYLNDLVRFEIDYDGYVDGNAMVSTAVTEMHTVLDQILNIDHEVPGP